MSDTTPLAALAGDTWIATPDGAVPIADLAPGTRPGTATDLDVKVVGLHGVPVRGLAVQHVGAHLVLAVVAGERELRCTLAQPLLSRVVVDGRPRLVWRPAGELVVGDLIAIAEPGPAGATGGRERTAAAVDPAHDVPGAPEVGFFGWAAVELVVALGAEPVHSLGVYAPDRAYVTDGFVSRSSERTCPA